MPAAAAPESLERGCHNESLRQMDSLKPAFPEPCLSGDADKGGEQQHELSAPEHCPAMEPERVEVKPVKEAVKAPLRALPLHIKAVNLLRSAFCGLFQLLRLELLIQPDEH